jgi:AraC family transcriptional regulator
MPCVEVDPSMPCPDGMTTIEIPSGRYARFTFNGHISGFSSWVDEMDGIVMPASGLRRRNAPEFERYDERWDAHTGMGPVDFYIPIEA